jgi:antitoxin component HigA of HigAB toxin-antitoxin module
MNQDSASNLVHSWNTTVKGYIETLRNYLEVFNQKQSDCEYELHQMVTNTSIKLTERKTLTLELMEEQEKIIELIDDLERILQDSGDSV